jgi:hypothetical protein
VRQRHDGALVKESALEPFFSSSRAKAVAVVDNVHAATVPCGEAFEPSIDELGDQSDEGETHVADRHEQRRTRHVRVP